MPLRNVSGCRLLSEVMANRSVEERRSDPSSRLASNAMRCASCGTVWYSAIAHLTATWAECARCGGHLHTERRAQRERALA
jgi:uncharacterized paraquat-inducible protein A